MNTILQLREKRAKTWDTAKAFLDERRGENGLISPEDTATYEKMEADVVAMGREIERLERQAAMDAELAKPVNQPITNPPLGMDGEEKTGRASNAYRASFWEEMQGKTSMDIRNALKIGEDTQGGYLVPDEFERQLVDGLEEENVMRRLANIITTSSGDRKIAVSATKGEASWVDEAGEIPEADNTFGQVTISAYKLATMIRISEELLNDSAFNMPGYIAGEFSRRIGSKEEEAFLVGDGVGKPTGVLADAGGAELGVTTASATAVSLDEVLDLFYALKAPYRRMATFLMNDSTVKAIRKLKDSTGQYIWQPSVTAGTPDTILNRPLITSAYIPALEAGKKVMAFGALRYYWIADRQARVFKRLNELYAKTGQIGFLAWQRVDGRLVLPEAVKYMQAKG